MRCLFSKTGIFAALFFVCALTVAGSAFANVNCPKGCVPSGYGNSCIYTSTNVSCGDGTIDQPSTPPSSGGGTGGGGTQVIIPLCNGKIDPDFLKQTVNKCVADITTTSQVWGCLFEDEAGKAEDAHLNMTCAERKAAYARECLKRCADFAGDYLFMCQSHDKGIDGFWADHFGDIGGKVYGAARVEGCGPQPKAQRYQGTSKPKIPGYKKVP